MSRRQVFKLWLAAATRRRECDKACHKAAAVGMAVPESKASPTCPDMSASGILQPFNQGVVSAF